MRAIATAPAIALKMMKKLLSRSLAVAPGMNSAHFAVRSFIRPPIRFLILNFARAMSGASVTTGQPLSG